MIDAAVFTRKAETAGVKVDRKKVENLISIGKKLGTHDIRDLALIKTNGGDPNQHLQTLHMNLGQEESFLPAERRVEGLTKLIVRVKSTIDSILAIPALLKSMDKALIESLEEKITFFKKKLEAAK